MPRVDPALRFGVVGLRRRPGEIAPVEFSTQSIAVRMEHGRVLADRGVIVRGELESSLSGVGFRGFVTATLELECRRCGEYFTAPLEIEVEELFEDHPDEGETYPIVNDEIDLTDVLHEAISIAIPTLGLCSADCAGPAPAEFPIQSEDEESPRGDPRWKILDDARSSEGGA